MTTLSVVTTFPPNRWTAYAKRMLQSHVKFWPDDVKLYAYHEGDTPDFVNEKIKYILDPHTAVAFRARLSKKNKSRLDNTVVLGTAHPYKFLETVEPNLYYKKSIPVPKQFSDIMDKKEKFDIIGNTNSEVKNYILGKIQ